MHLLRRLPLRRSFAPAQDPDSKDSLLSSLYFLAPLLLTCLCSTISFFSSLPFNPQQNQKRCWKTPLSQLCTTPQTTFLMDSNPLDKFLLSCCNCIYMTSFNHALIQLLLSIWTQCRPWRETLHLLGNNPVDFLDCQFHLFHKRPWRHPSLLFLKMDGVFFDDAV
jgi:hypothetical protein